MASMVLAFNTMAQSAPVDTLLTSYDKRPVNHITESARVLDTEQLNQGIIYSTEQLLTGQIAGLRVLPSGGAPGAGSEMVLRLGNSIFGNRSPLVVLDGVPLDNNSASDYTGALSFLSTHDIESVTMLKDAAAMAVYGGRAADGVLYITTKKGSSSSKIKVDFTSRAGISMLGKKANVLNTGEFSTLINREFPERSHLLGNSETDWQDVIYRKALSHDQHVGLSGTVLKTVPYRISFSHLNQNGILKTAKARRNSLALTLNPSFLKDHLLLDLHVRKVDEKLSVADKFAIPTAMAFDPTQPVYEENNFGGYRIYKHSDGTPNIYAMRNPLAMLEQRQDDDKTATLYGHARLQYKLHFFPSLSVNARYARMEQNNDFSSVKPFYIASSAPLERMIETKDRKINWEQKEAFLAYNQSFARLSSRIRLVTGAVLRENYNERNIYPTLNDRGQAISGFNYTSGTVRSETLYGQLSFMLKDRYLVETSLAKDNASYLPSTESSSLTGSAGASWDIAKEALLSTNNFISSLRLYTNFGSFIKQGGTIGSIKSMPRPDLRPEQTTKWNAGLAWGLLNNRLSGDFNYFKSNTSDMLLHMKVASGSGYSSYTINGGGFISSGLESNLSFQILNGNDFRWSLGANLTSLQSEMSDFELAYTAYVYGESNFVLLPGQPINSFYLYEQLYDPSGKPIEKGYVKGPNGNVEKQGLETTDPTLLFGIRSEASYKKLSAGFLFRGSTGNYVFNAVDAHRNALYMADGYTYLENIPGDYAETGFQMPQRSSSHFLENASFARLEYLHLTYDLGRVLQDRANFKLSATAQNAFVITKYKGQDPEVGGGIDRGQYPQPRTLSVGLHLSI